MERDLEDDPPLMHADAFMTTPAGHIPGITPLGTPAVTGESSEAQIAEPAAETDVLTRAEAASTPIYIDPDEVVVADEGTAVTSTSIVFQPPAPSSAQRERLRHDARTKQHLLDWIIEFSTRSVQAVRQRPGTNLTARVLSRFQTATTSIPSPLIRSAALISTVLSAWGDAFTPW